uniref:ADAM metallopeptidase with thrombospondin type 1 motif 20 n=1 Tax=Astyanax mexicanus TaxID=7994 RepID=A0A3B1IPV9_ASTMX
MYKLLRSVCMKLKQLCLRTQKQLSDYEILHFRRRRSAFGQRFLLNLSADASFIAPSYTVTHLGARGRRGAADECEQQQEEQELRHCFFTGHVNEEREHRAVFSLCTGLIGTFTTHSGEYFLEPLMRFQKVFLYIFSFIFTDLNENGINLRGNGSLLEELKSTWETMDNHVPKMHQTDSKSPSSGSRKKRFLSYPRFVELMVTADAKMVRHHGRNLEHYILTIMSVVAAVYKDPSVGNLINIMIVKLIVIHNEQEGPNVNFYAATTLHNFCVWQQSHNVLDDSHPSHHDTALLITREDICRAKDKCDTLGLAELGTMCDPYRSCSISEENGLSSAFTIAHELGHVFNMPHDDNPKCREAGIKHQYHVMAPTLNYDTSPWSCTGYGECLLDEPVGKTYDLPVKLPGQLYNVNRQCELMFGPGSQVCPFMKQCKRLWCTSAEGDHKGCRTQHMPLADGTDCGHGMYCKHGMCVNKEIESRPVHGEWGPWGPYSVCSRTCGGGTRSTSRDCNKPAPKNGGRFCVGRRMKFRSCNTEPCPRDQKDFREEQCSHFDGKHFNINGLPPTIRWVPKYSGILMKDRCKLFCRVAGTMAYYQLRDRVVDGTPCGPDTYDICVQGLCRQAGCDHVLNSKARNDKCGVCGGDNSSCRTVAGTFNNAQYGYNVVVRIPAGATNIDIKQVSYSGTPEDDNYLALSDSRSNFLLNGNLVVSMFKREISFKGTEIEYSGSNTTVERINCTERIEDELILQVLCVGSLYNPDVRYSFNIPIEEQREQFVWDTSGPWQECSRMCQGDFQKCSSTCEGGFQRRVVVCQDSEGRSTNYCDERVKPSESKSCDSGPCPLWNYGIWGECTQSCGGGQRTRLVVCQRPNGQRLNEHNCDMLDKPPDVEQCNMQPCPGSASWHRRPWKSVR